MEIANIIKKQASNSLTEMECDLDSYSDAPIERKPPAIAIIDVDLQESISQSRLGDSSSYSRYRNDPSQTVFDQGDSPVEVNNSNEQAEISGLWSGKHS